MERINGGAFRDKVLKRIDFLSLERRMGSVFSVAISAILLAGDMGISGTTMHR